MTTDIINIKNAFLGLIRGSIRAPIMLFGALVMSTKIINNIFICYTISFIG